MNEVVIQGSTAESQVSVKPEAEVEVAVCFYKVNHRLKPLGEEIRPTKTSTRDSTKSSHLR